MIKRRTTRPVQVGNLQLGGSAPVLVQTMTNAPASDLDQTLSQIYEATDAGCDLIRCAVPTVKHVDIFAEIIKKSPIPVVADIHFDCRIALGAIDAGVHKIRINPGNMGDWSAIYPILDKAKNKGIPIRIGLNGGSVKHKNQEDDRPLEQALVEEAMSYVERFEDYGFHDIVLSLKASDAMTTIAVNRKVAELCDYPIHLGVTEAGPEEQALLKSAVGIGALLADGIGDTIRLSFTAPPVREVIAGKKLLRAAGLLKDAPELISCPTCGRCSVDLQKLAQEVSERLTSVRIPIKVAVMGCEVNGPGEAKEADVGIAGAGGQVMLFAHGECLRKVPVEQAVDELMEEINSLLKTKA